MSSVRIGITGLEMNTVKGKVYPCSQLYFQAVLDNGGIPVAIPSFINCDEALRFLDNVDGMVFIGGPDLPAHYFDEEDINGNFDLLCEKCAEIHMVLVRETLKRGLPFLGVCLGHQELNVGDGGKLIQHLEELTPTHRSQSFDPETGARLDVYHNARLVPGSRLAAIFGQEYIRINSCHHQAVRDDAHGRECRITAYSDDGVAEAAEWPGDKFRIGVQWHPERIDDAEHRRRLFTAFIDGCRG